MTDAMRPDISKISAALLRPQTYVGHAREAVNVVRCIARFPLGVAEAALTSGNPRGDWHDTPVLLVHGFAHNRSGWYVLDKSLRRRGFTSVHTFNYNPWRHTVAELGRQLARRVDEIKALTGADKVDVIGHSLGGIVTRWYVQELGGDAHVRTAITVASPHEGTVVARLARGPVASQLLPGSPLLRRLAASARATDVRWIAYYSNLDLLVQPATSARLLVPALRAKNVLLKDHGHMSIMVSPQLAVSVADELEAAATEARLDLAG